MSGLPLESYHLTKEHTLEKSDPRFPPDDPRNGEASRPAPYSVQGFSMTLACPEIVYDIIATVVDFEAEFRRQCFFGAIHSLLPAP